MSSVSKDNIKNLLVTLWLATKKVSLRVMGSCPCPLDIASKHPKNASFCNISTISHGAYRPDPDFIGHGSKNYFRSWRLQSVTQWCAHTACVSIPHSIKSIFRTMKSSKFRLKYRTHSFTDANQSLFGKNSNLGISESLSFFAKKV